MRSLHGWKIGDGTAVELSSYEPGREPSREDLEQFLGDAKIGPPPLPFQTWRYELRDKAQTLAWLVNYIACEAEYLRANFVQDDRSFYIALLEHTESGDRSASFRLSNSGLAWPSEWKVSVRRVCVDGEDDRFLCAEA